MTFLTLPYWKDKSAAWMDRGNRRSGHATVCFAGVPTASISRTDVYGYHLATVMSDGTNQFEFK